MRINLKEERRISPKSLCNGYLYISATYLLSVHKKFFTLLNIADIYVVISASIRIVEFIEKGTDEYVRA